MNIMSFRVADVAIKDLLRYFGYCGSTFKSIIN